MKKFLIAIAVLTSVTAMTVNAQDAKKAPAKSEVKKEQCDKKKECCKEKAERKVAVKLLKKRNNAVRRLQRKRQNNRLIAIDIHEGVTAGQDSFFCRFM